MLKSTLALSLAVASATAFAGEPTKEVVQTETEKSWCESLWEYPVLYKNQDTFIQEFRLTGRFHGDVYSVNADEGSDQDWVIRRLRAGAVLKLQGNIELKAEVQFDPQNADPAYTGFTDLYIAWKPCEAFNIKAGKIPMEFTREGEISSNNLQTLERSNLANNLWFPQEYFTGVSVSGKINNWVYDVAVASSDVNKEFGDFEASAFGVVSLGYDFGKALGVKKALLRGDYVYQDPDPRAVNTRPYEHVASLHFDYETARWGFGAEVAGGLGFGTQGDVWGGVLQPFYKITDKFEVVGRYTHLQGDTDSIRLNNRYEGRVVSGKGDQYDEFYAGLNYYICGHHLKLQTGLTYAMMEDSAHNGGEYHGYSWVSGIRFSF